MLNNLFCEAYHQGEQIKAICCHSVCVCTTRLACALCIREEIHQNDPNFNFRSVKHPQKILDRMYDLIGYNKIKFDMIAEEVCQAQIKIYIQATQILEGYFQQIEYLDNIFLQAQKLDQEINQIMIYDYVIQVAKDNKSVIDCINDYKQQIFELHQQVKNNSTSSQINNRNNKDFQQLMEFLKIKIQQKQELSQNYGSLRQKYESFYQQEDLLKEIENSKIQQNIKNIEQFVRNSEDFSEINTRQEIRQTQFDFIQLGDTFFSKQDNKSAKIVYKLETLLHPENSLGFQKLGECLLAQRKFLKAITCYKSFKGSEQENVKFQVLTAKAMFMNHQLQDARKLLFNLLQQYPGNKEIRDELGNSQILFKET
ncbi:hypothetical protein pb186bvf_010935 [Paramecium bursaria]